MKLVVVTADYNRHDDTLACLDSLWQCYIKPNRVIVIDNGSAPAFSTNNTPPNTEILRLEHNRGFAVAFNLGIQRALHLGATVILLLNNDTLVAPDFLGPLLATLTCGASIAAPRIYYASDPNRIWAEGFTAHPWTLEWGNSLRGQPEHAVSSVPRAVDYVTGCAMLVKRQVFEAIGFFDERFFAYYEDMDFCLRARRAGFRIVTVPTSHVWHKVSATAGANTPRRQYLLARSSVLFFTKHAGRRWPIILAYRTGSLIKTLIRFAWLRRSDLIAAHIKGIADGYRDAQRAKK